MFYEWLKARFFQIDNAEEKNKPAPTWNIYWEMI